MKITYEIYKDTPHLTKADMSDAKELTVNVTRGDAICVKFAGEERKISRGYATFNTEGLKDDVYRITLFTKSGAHELIPISIAFGTAKLYHKDELTASLYSSNLDLLKRVDSLSETIKKLNDAVFGSKLF